MRERSAHIPASNLTGERFVREFTPLAVRTRRTNVRTRIQHPEYRIQKVENALRREDSVVPSGRIGFGADFPGTSSLANFRCRFATLPNEARETAATGQWMAGKRVQVGKGGRGLGK